MSIRDALEHIKGLNAYQLAGYAESSDPDTLESPGAEFLGRVRNDVAERLEWSWEQLSEEERENISLEEFGESLNDDGFSHEIADSAVPIYNHQRMQVLTDLAAWQEDVSDYSAGDSDIITLAGYALYIVAERLVNALISEVAESDSEEEA